MGQAALKTPSHRCYYLNKPTSFSPDDTRPTFSSTFDARRNIEQREWRTILDCYPLSYLFAFLWHPYRVWVTRTGLSLSFSLPLSLVLFELNTIIIDSNYWIRINSKKIIIDIYPFVFRYLFTRSNISNNISNDIKKITYYFIFNSYLIVHNINLSLKLVTI